MLRGPMFSDPVLFLSQHPAALLTLVFAAAAIEYVFPPFWGDTLMLAGSFVAGVDRRSMMAVFAAAVFGSCLGAAVAWWMGRRFGQASMRVFRRSARAQRIAGRAEKLFADHGSRVLALNRFIPGLRAFFLPLAGAGRLPFRPTMVWATVSNLLYCGIVVLAGFFIASRSPDFADFQSHVRLLMLVAAGVSTLLMVGMTAWHLLRRAEARA
jgi:membrane protein DedA with SNARE-associated domain